jgi:hypothetical protein
MKIKSIIPELKINLIHDNNNIISNENYELLQKLVDDYIFKYSKKYPHFLIINIDIHIIDENNYQIDESTIEFTYFKEFISFLQLYDDEKIYISKEKIKIIGLKDFFEKVKLQPFEENESNISIFGETYRELRDNFNKVTKRYL